MHPPSSPNRTRLFSLGLLPLLLALTACAIPDRLHADRELKRLCSTPDRIIVHEVVELPAGSFQEDGQPKVENKQGAIVIAGDFALERVSYSTLLQVPKHNLQLTRLTSRLVRISTGAVLAEATNYCRAGGDTFSVNNTSECCAGDPSMTKLALKRANP